MSEHETRLRAAQAEWQHGSPHQQQLAASLQAMFDKINELAHARGRAERERDWLLAEFLRLTEGQVAEQAPQPEEVAFILSGGRCETCGHASVLHDTNDAAEVWWCRVTDCRCEEDDQVAEQVDGDQG